MKIFYRLASWVGTVHIIIPLAASLAYRSAQSISGALILFAVSKYFSPIEQGYYYLFASIIALQLFIDLGLNVVVLNMASHEWAIIKNDPNKGDVLESKVAQSRLASLVIVVAKWYMAGAFILIICGYMFGTSFFMDKGLPTDQWHKQWIAHLLFSSALLFVSPFLSILEGCNRVSSINIFRATQIIFSSAIFILTASDGFGLTSVAIFSASMLILAVFYVSVVNYKFFKGCLSQIGSAKISWKNEIWPLQGKISLQAIFSYLGYYALILIVSHSNGAAAAGQFGLSLQVGMMILQLSLAFVTSNIPTYGIMHATGEVKSAIQKWKHDVLHAMIFAVFVVAFIYAVQRFNTPSIFAIILDRGVPGMSAVLIYIGACSLVLVQSIAAITRSNKSEILTLVGVSSPIIIAVLSYFFSNISGIQGVAIVYFSVNSLFTLPVAVISFRAYLLRLI